MAAERIAAALARLESVLRLRPTFGDCEETPAIARWQGGAKLSVCHPKGHLEVLTDLPLHRTQGLGQCVHGRRPEPSVLELDAQLDRQCLSQRARDR